MITRIGIVAGEIWSYLDGHGKEALIEDIIVSLKRDRDIVLMSMGWLSREGHISVKAEQADYRIKLT